MPLKLNAPVEEVIQPEVKNTYDQVVISGHYADNKNGQLHIMYDTYLNGDLVTTGASIVLSGADFMAMLERNPTLYEILKNVLYAELMSALGLSGNVT